MKRQTLKSQIREYENTTNSISNEKEQLRQNFELEREKLLSIVAKQKGQLKKLEDGSWKMEDFIIYIINFIAKYWNLEFFAFGILEIEFYKIYFENLRYNSTFTE